MFCVNCGKQIGDYSRFCPFCGHELPELEPDASTAQAEEPPVVPVAEGASAPAPDAQATTQIPRVAPDAQATTQIPRVAPESQATTQIPRVASGVDAQATTQIPRVAPTYQVSPTYSAAPTYSTAPSPAGGYGVVMPPLDYHDVPSPADPPAGAAQPGSGKPKRKKNVVGRVLLALLVVIVVAVLALIGCAAGGVFGDETGLDGVLAFQDKVVSFVGGDDEGDDDSDGTPEGQGELVAFYEEIDDDSVVEYGDYHYVDGQILVVGVSDATYDEMEALFAEYGGEIVGYISYTNDYQVDLSGNYTYDELVAVCEEIAGDALVDSADISYVEEVVEDSVDYTADPWTDSSNVSDTSGSVWDEDDPDGLNWWAEAVNLLSVWSLDIDYATVKVGVIDSMFDLANDDLTSVFVEVWGNPTYDDGTCSVADLYASDTTSDSKYSHGTHVAGIIAATGENGFGITGTAQNVELYGFALKGGSFSSWSNVYTWKYAFAVMFDEGVQVINISQGYRDITQAAADGDASALAWLENLGDALSDFLQKYIDGGYEFLIFDSAGNNGGVDASYDFLGIIDDEEVAERIIVVGAADNAGDDTYTVRSTSNVGDRVDVWAPGGDILSLVPGDATDVMSGTSMATPIVAGIAAIVWGINPDLTASEVRAILLDLDDGDSSWFSNVIDWIKDKVSGLFGSDEAEAAAAGDSVTVIDAYRCVQEALETVGDSSWVEDVLNNLGNNGDDGDDSGDGDDDDTWQIDQVDDEEAVEDAEGDATLFETLAGTYVFTSGAGGWGTTLTLYADGTFTGVYSDSEMGEMDDDYPDGTVYISEFSGSFSAPVQTSEGVWTMTVESLTVSYTIDSSNLYVDVSGTAIGDEYIIDGIRYVVTTPYGLTGSGETVTVYAPGVALSDTPIEELEITNVIGSEGLVDGALAVYVIYAPGDSAAFVYYEALEGEGDSTGSDSAEEAYAKFAEGYALLTATGSWYEYLEMDIWVSVTDGSQTQTESYSYYQDATVSGWDEDDQSNLLITGSGSMDVGTDYVWTYTYADGVISVTYTEPYSASGEQEQDPAIFGASALTSDMMSNVDIVSDYCIEFTVASSYLDDLGIGALDTIDIAGDVEDLTYSDLQYAVYFDDDGVLTGVYLYFSVTFSMYGYDAYAEYQIYYGFD